jgi:hypothetical protein
MSPAVRALPAGQVLPSGLKDRSVRATTGGAARPDCPDAVVARLEQAGATLLAMPASGYSTRMRQMRFDIVHTALEAYGWENAAIRPPVPSAAEISAMDEAFGWLCLIPETSFVLRRIVGARALVHPLTWRHLYPWRRLGSVLGADHKSVQRWHVSGVAMILEALNRLA